MYFKTIIPEIGESLPKNRRELNLAIAYVQTPHAHVESKPRVDFRKKSLKPERPIR